MNHVDHVAENLKKHDVNTLAFLDAPMYFEMAPENP
jgi:hypothetical protein